MSKKYEVLVTGHLCKNKYMAKGGEVIDESQLLSPATELVNKKFIKEVVEKNPTVAKKKTVTKKEE